MTDTETSVAGITPADAAPPGVAPNGADAAPQRPAFIPEKFWDRAAGRVRLEDLAQSYRALERKLGRGAELRRSEDTPPQRSPDASPARILEPDAASPNARASEDRPGDEGPTAADAAADAGADANADDADADASIPATPEDYAVEVSHPWLERDAELDGLLHAAGFTQAQAQLVYDLAAERVIPVIEAMAREYEQRLGQSRLEAHFGGTERFEALARQVRAWGERHLPKALFETLSATPDGIVALHHMMRAGEPRFLAGDKPAAGPSQDELETLVRDPRYWRDHEPELVKRVEEGFRRLYPGV